MSTLKSSQEVQNYLNCHPIVARIIWNREFRTTSAIDQLMKPELSQLPDPKSILDLSKAVERAIDAIANDEPIAVYGDYDVDGTCGSSLLVDFFKSLGVEVQHYQPNRFSEGYGVHSAALEKLMDQGVQVIFTVDCGITAVEPAKICKARGVDLIILDHHKVGAELPDAYAVVDPQRPEDTSGLTTLCGTAIAFFFVMALRSELRDVGFFEDRPEPNLMRLLDLVAIATVADVMDIRGINRILVTHGLRVMARNPRPGVKALLDAAKIDKPTAMHCGFVLGPRINAAGRLESAKAAYDLLVSADAENAKKLALELEDLNTARKAAQESVVQYAREQALEQIANPRWAELGKLHSAAELGPWPRALVLASPEGLEHPWHEGVLGIAASKIVEEFGRPVFVLSEKEDAKHILKGSVRSIPKIDILSAISAQSVSTVLIAFGGHAHAGGVTLERSRLQEFLEAINVHMAITTSAEQFHREQRFDAEVELSEIDGRLVEELKQLEPFGHKFPEPVLKIAEAKPVDVKVLKEKHLKFRLLTSKSGGRAMDALWFNSPLVSSFGQDQNFTLWVSPQWNEWQGVKKLQLFVKHSEAVAAERLVNGNI